MSIYIVFIFGIVLLFILSIASDIKLQKEKPFNFFPFILFEFVSLNIFFFNSSISSKNFSFISYFGISSNLS
jgi:hypothetical protein